MKPQLKPTQNPSWLRAMESPMPFQGYKSIDPRFLTIVRDQKRRCQFEKLELPNLVRKSILSRFARLALVYSVFVKMKRKKGTITRIRNRCIISGRSRILGTFGLSRISFRRLAGLGQIPGLVKI
jgi:ribosomal protein S14